MANSPGNQPYDPRKQDVQDTRAEAGSSFLCIVRIAFILMLLWTCINFCRFINTRGSERFFYDSGKAVSMLQPDDTPASRQTTAAFQNRTPVSAGRTRLCKRTNLYRWRYVYEPF